jgi:hypothetical protein
VDDRGVQRGLEQRVDQRDIELLPAKIDEQDRRREGY